MSTFPTSKVQNDTARFLEAVYLGAHDVIKELLNDGVCANSMDDTGKTVLMIAAHEGFPITLQMQLDHGARVNAQDKHGDTALHWAVAMNDQPADPACLTILINAGANLEARNSLMQTPLLKCARNAVEHLNMFGSAEDYLRSLTALIAKGADIDARDSHGDCVCAILEKNRADFDPDKHAEVLAILDQRLLQKGVMVVDPIASPAPRM